MIDEDVVIKVENVSKKYSKSLKRSMLYGVADIGRNMAGLSSHSERLRPGEFWAVNNVSFEIRRGETLGLIGPNGSGKTTLLKMLNGIFWPDKGKITVKGRVGALIAVGAGFHPLLTGRENVYVNGAILGMSKREIDKKFDSIVDFADIGDFLDAPVKHYSSGMFVRLGFAVAVHCEPDVLLVDEVLAVGDINFQHKCLRYMADLMSRCAVILVSHNPDVIRFVCEKALFLNSGQLKIFGSAREGVDQYVNYMVKRSLPEQEKLKSRSRYDPKAYLLSVKFLDKNNNEIEEIEAGESICIEGLIKVIEPLTQSIVGIAFYLDAHERSFVCYSSQVGRYYDINEGEHVFHLSIPNLNLRAGYYHVGVVVAEKHELASHTWSSQAYFLVKNPRPEYGLYNMTFRFDMDQTSW